MCKYCVLQIFHKLFQGILVKCLLRIQLEKELTLLPLHVLEHEPSCRSRS